MKNKGIEFTITEISEVTGHSRATIYRAIKDRSLFRSKNGMISLSRSQNGRWLAENGINLNVIKPPIPKRAGRRPSGVKPPIEYPPQDILCMNQVKLGLARANLKLKLLKLANVERKNIPTEVVTNELFSYLDSVEKTVRSVTIKQLPEIGRRICAAGELLPEHINDFNNSIIGAIHSGKLSKINDLNKSLK
jgi:hypothetical protein